MAEKRGTQGAPTEYAILNEDQARPRQTAYKPRTRIAPAGNISARARPRQRVSVACVRPVFALVPL